MTHALPFTPAARRRLAKLPLAAAAALYEHLTGPVAENRAVPPDIDDPTWRVSGAVHDQ